ncbi:hydantoinase/oxoprolinase family protein [Butyricicoccus faecihominis]|uniref:hydantoinase/oxoprolinase family protein n=1 Tax=Butyricicoccus faecihominis TaxID=1712515 RepID=UPI0024794567|nr:hydantoinase/oxoprolinase family protein [Butyricicoccus faecihominis]MCQ5130090.1 hydantoinase/oxoprolinase family protein [Butyricicoccus faecihominis]
MQTILGIDTGGTYTDSVIITTGTQAVLHKAKVLTTPQNLRDCIARSFEQIPPPLREQLSAVYLSTTLATNAIALRRGAEAGLILIGAKPEGRLPTSLFRVMRGRHDIKGRVIQNLDPTEVEQTVDFFRGKAAAIAISGYASIRNPAHEAYVRNVVEERLHIPVVCAHELSSALGFYERTVTAVLNARLIPAVHDLIRSVKAEMARFDLSIPLMIVKGNGCLMHEAYARLRPIETLLSGPAASANGGRYLAKARDCIVLDMGGTTTDLVNVTNGDLQIQSEGARIAGWSTRVKAAEVFTVGLGGDSRIHASATGEIRIGPEKVIPFCRAGTQYPCLLQEIGEIYRSQAYDRFSYHDYEAFVSVDPDNACFAAQAKPIWAALTQGPHTFAFLAEAIRLPNLHAIIEELVRQGRLLRIALTPTDVLHVTGEYCPWDRRLPAQCLAMFSARCKTDTPRMISLIQQTMGNAIDRALFQAALYFDRPDLDFTQNDAVEYFLAQLNAKDTASNLVGAYRLQKQVVAIGAPAVSWMRQAGRKLQLTVVVPPHADIANAIGAAVASRRQQLDILIRRESVTAQFIVYSPQSRTAHGTIAAATAHAIRSGTAYMRRLTQNPRLKPDYKIEDLEIAETGRESPIFIERMIRFCAAQ